MRDKVRNKLKKRKVEEDEDDSDRIKTKERLETRLVNKKGRHSGLFYRQMKKY